MHFEKEFRWQNVYDTFNIECGVHHTQILAVRDIVVIAYCTETNITKKMEGMIFVSDVFWPPQTDSSDFERCGKKLSTYSMHINLRWILALDSLWAEPSKRKETSYQEDIYEQSGSNTKRNSVPWPALVRIAFLTHL